MLVMSDLLDNHNVNAYVEFPNGTFTYFYKRQGMFLFIRHSYRAIRF
jgi:hypothetical protein